MANIQMFSHKETKTVCMNFLFSHASYMSCPSHPSLVQHMENFITCTTTNAQQKLRPHLT